MNDPDAGPLPRKLLSLLSKSGIVFGFLLRDLLFVGLGGLWTLYLCGLMN